MAIDKFYESAANSMAELDDVDLDGSGHRERQRRKGRPATRARRPTTAPVVRFVNKMLLDAIKGGASDLHFEPYEKAYRVRLPHRRHAA